MTQRTLEKLDRALKSLDIVTNSFCKDIVEAPNAEERAKLNKEYDKYLDLLTDLTALRNKAESALYLAKKMEEQG